ncbi:MAG: hypothetical protein ACXWB2_19365 [Acidimicrobiales bacterium]
MSDSDGLNPENPEAEGLTPPELSEEEIEGDRLLANEARGRLRPDGFTDVEIDRWVKIYYTKAEGGVDQGDVEGLIAFIREQQESGSAD